MYSVKPLPKDHEVRAVAVVFEKYCVSSLPRRDAHGEAQPPLAWPPTDYVLKSSKARTRRSTPSHGVFKIWKRCVPEKGELADFAKSLVGVMSIPEATAISDKLPVGKTAHGNRGGRIHAATASCTTSRGASRPSLRTTSRSTTRTTMGVCFWA